MVTAMSNTKSIISEVLRVNCALLEDNLSDSCNLARHLFSLRLMSSNEFELVKAAGSGTRHEKTRKLVDFLQTKDDIVLDHVLDYLLKDGTQLHIFRKLKESAEKLGYKWQFKLVEEAKISTNQVLPEKWWPKKKTLPNSFFPRTDTVKGQLLIETVHQQLHSTKNRTMAIVAQTQSLVGMGGVGKTTTAKWYGNEYEGHYDHVLWIDAEGTSLEISCTSLAKDMSIPVKDSDNDKKSMKKLMSEVNTKLRDCKCVFIFDNVERYIDVRELLSTNSSHYTIITSRMLGDWGNSTEEGRIPTCEVNVFKEEESLRFLKQALPLAEEMDDDKLPIDEELRELGELLGYLPLALQCAVTVIINPVFGWTFKSYLEQIKSDLKILTDKEILDEYTRPLSSALTLSLDHIGRASAHDSSKHRELCRRIMHVTAYCNPERIDEEMFTHLQDVLDVTGMQVASAVDDLIKFSLLTVNAGIKSERGRRKLNIHRVLQHVLKTSVEADPQHESKVLRLVLMYFQSDYKKHEDAAISVWKKVLEKHENVLQEFPQFGVHLAREANQLYRGMELIELSLPPLMKVYGTVGLPIFQYNIQLAYLFMHRKAYDRADSILKELKVKVTGAEAEFREDIQLHIRIASFTLMCASDSDSMKKMKLDIMNEYSDLLEKARNSKLNDDVSEYTIHHWLFIRNFLKYNSLYYSSRAKLAVVCNYTTVLYECDEFAVIVDTICAHLGSLNCPACDIVKMEDFRRVMDLFGGYRISSFPYQDLFKFYTWLKSHELISHWMQTNLDGQDDKHVAQFINAYLQSLVTKNEKEALLCEMEYLYQLTGPPKKKFFLIDGFLRNISNLSPGKTERRSYRSQALKYLWKFLRPLANSYYGGEKEYAVVLLRLREAYSYELLRNDMYSEAKAFENEVFGSLQAYCSEFRSTDIEIYEFSIFRSAHFVGAFGVQTNVMQEIWKLRLRTNVELLNSGIRIRGLLEDTVVALAATNQSAKIEPLLMAQTNKKVVFYFQFPAPAIDILLREGKHLTIVAISRWLIQRLPSDSLLFGENVVEIFEWLVKVGEVGWSESIQLFRTHYKELSDSLLRRILKSMPQEEMFSQIRGELSQRLKEIGTTSISSIMTQEEMFSQIQSELSQGLKETGKSSISSIATSLSGGSSSPNSIIKKYRKKCCLL